MGRVPVEENQALLGEVFDTPGPRVGETLKRAREAKGLDLAGIANSTRIPLRHLTAIEADAHDSLPALTYSLGFVKTYARVVGLDPAAIAAQFRAETNKTEHVPLAMVPIEPMDEKRLPSRGAVVGGVVGVAAIIGIFIAYGAGVFDPAPPAPTPPIAASEPITQPDENPAPVADAAAPAIDPAMAQPTDPAAADPAAAADATTPPTDGATAAATVPAGSVVITASDDAWFKVYGPAGTVKMGILKTGESYSVPAGDGLMLWTGKAGALKLTVSGRTIAPLGAPDQMVKDVSLAPADLLARGG
jgi:cytoskeletal protein RodZ